MTTNQQIFNIIHVITALDFDSDALNNLLLTSDTQTLCELLATPYAIDVADAVRGFSNQQIIAFYKIVGAQGMAKLMEQACENLQRIIVEILRKQDVLEIFTHMSNDDITDILGHLRTDTQKELLNLMREFDKGQITKLLSYGEDTAGGIMTTEYISLREHLTVGDALDKIRKIGPTTEVIETIFIVGQSTGFKGSCDLRDILTADPSCTLADITNDNVITVKPFVDQEEVSRLVSKYDLKVIPVVNRKGWLLGIITVDDIIDVLVEEQTEDMLKFGGISGEEGVNSSVWQSVKVRLPWLLINLVTASFSALVISRFESVIAQVVALSAIMPIVAATSGNSGSQTLAIIIRSITLCEIDLAHDWRRVRKEIAVGVVNSCVTGSIAGVVVLLMYGNIYLSLIIFSAMLLNSLVSSSCGFFIPLTLKALKLDPALASNIFLTAATDIMAFLIFLGLASNFLQYLA